jgi:hypothetical protein
MKQVIVMLIAMLACAVVMPAICAPAVTSTNQAAPLLDPAQTPLPTTPSQAEFLRDDWLPKPFVPEMVTSTDTKKKSTTQDINKTKKSNLTSAPLYAIQNFLNDAWTPPRYTNTIDTAIGAKKGGAIKQSGLAIEQFLDDNWTPGTTVVAVSDGAGYKKGKMS